MLPKTLRLVIFAYGNPSRGDDALAPQLLHLLEQHHLLQENVEIIEDFQLQVEHALGLINQDLALFIDASVSCPPPFTFTRLHPLQDSSYTTHALHPAAILHVYQQTQNQSPPPAFLLSLRGKTFELGEPLSSNAINHLTAALEWIQPLLQTPDLATWQRLAE
jgi:hydrogenase maturation protease